MAPGNSGSPHPGPFLSFGQGPLQACIFEHTGQLTLSGPDLAGAAHANEVAFTSLTAKVGGQVLPLGRVVSSVSLPDGLELTQSLGTGTVRTRLTFPLDGVMRYEVVDWGGVVPEETSVTAPSSAAEHFYGLGEKFNALDQSGKKARILTFDSPGNKGDHSYKVAPWFVSTRGYGFHLDSSAESFFDLRASAPDRYIVTNLFPSLRFDVIYGPRLTDVLSRYTGYTGRPALPPPWAFGPWISSDVWRTGGEVRYAVEQFRARRLPVSAFVFDSPWETAYNDFTFNQTQFGQGGNYEGKHYDGFASLAAMMAFFRDNGLKVICWMAPFVNTQSDTSEVAGQKPSVDNYGAGRDNHYFVRASAGGPPLLVPWWKGHGSPIDFTNPAARDWLIGQLKTLLAASEVVTRSGAKEPAIGGFKTDDGESGNGPNTYIPATAVYADGRTGREMRNGYCLEYHRTVWNVLGTKGVLFARSGFTGTPTFPGCWAGDNEPNFGTANGLPSVIVAGLSAALSGFAIWGHDIGGYQNTNFSPVSPADLFMRWAQFGCFTPIMQMHRQVKKDDLRQYPWGYPQAGETFDHNKALDNYRFYTRLHTQLFPYLYTYAKRSGDDGLPILRPLVLLHQDDPNTFGVQHAYYFGEELLVAPVIEPQQTQRVVYLPRGGWYDFWTGARHNGGQNVTWSNADPSRLPLFVREGAIVPMLLTEPDTLCDANYVNSTTIKTADDGLRFLIYPFGSSGFTLYDGTKVRSQAGDTGRTVTLTSAARPVALQVLGPEPATVKQDGTALTKFATPAELDTATAGWRYDAVTQFLHVKFTHMGGTTRVDV